MHIAPPRLSTSLTVLACLLAAVFPADTRSATVEGCVKSVFSQEDANGCSVSVGLNQKIDGGVYGGNATNGSANKNRVNIANSADISGSVYGGSASNHFNKESNHNEVVIGSNVKIGTEQGGDFVIGGSSHTSHANFNAVRIGDGATVNGFVTGGSGSLKAIHNDVEVDTSSNSVHIGSNSVITDGVSGGSGGKTSSFNEVYIGDNVRIGQKVSLINSDGGSILRGGSNGPEADFTSTQADSNIVHIGNDVAVGTIYGGSTAATFSSNNTANKNRVTIGDRSQTLFVASGDGWKNSTVTKNTLTVGNDAKMGEVYGGRSASGNVSENTVEIGRNLTANIIYGGDAYSAIAGEANANNNTVVIGENAKVAGGIFGGSGKDNANGNTVIIGKGFDINGILGGGTEAQGNANNNTVTLLGGGKITGKLYGGYSGSSGSGNTLNLGSSTPMEMNKLTAGEVGYFNTYNFYLPDTARSNDTVLKLENYTDLGKATVNAYVSGKADLKAGDVIHLIQGKSGDSLRWEGQGNVYQGVTLSRDLAGIALDGQSKNLDLTLRRNNIQNNGNNSANNSGKADNGSNSANNSGKANNGNNSANNSGKANNGSNSANNSGKANNGNNSANNSGKANNGNNSANNSGSANNGSNSANNSGKANNAGNNGTASAVNINPKTKSLLQGRLVAPALINGGSDYLSSGLDALYESTNRQASAAGNSGGFAGVRADNREVTTGSHVKLKGVALDAGYAWNRNLGEGKLLYGLAAEYGYTNYKAHLDDGTSGKGKAWNFGAAAFGNYLWNNGLYVQGSVRAGRVSGDYRSNDFVHAGGNSVSYDSSSNYVAGHVGAGKIWQLGSRNSLDTYVKYFDSHTSGDKAVLSSGETYDFASVRSQRGRAGMQYKHDLGKAGLRFGLAYEREWNGDVRAHYQGHALPSPTMKGGTTVGEAGVSYRLGSSQIDTSLQAFGGHQRGAGLRVGMKF